MPKEIHKIENFAGGISSGSDPRDIGDDQLHELYGMSVGDIGRLRMMGKFVASDIASPDADIYLRAGAGSMVYNADNNNMGAVLENLGAAETGTATSGSASILKDSSKNWVTDSLVGRTIIRVIDGTSGPIFHNTSTQIWATLHFGWSQWSSGNEYKITPSAQEQIPENYLVVTGTNGDLNIYEKSTTTWYLVSSDIALAASKDVGGFVKTPESHQGVTTNIETAPYWYITGRPYSSSPNGIWVYDYDGNHRSGGPEPNTNTNILTWGSGTSVRKLNSGQLHTDSGGNTHIYCLFYSYGGNWDGPGTTGKTTRGFVRRYNASNLSYDSSNWTGHGNDSIPYNGGNLPSASQGETLIDIPYGYSSDPIHRFMGEDLCRRDYKGVERWWITVSSGWMDMATGGWVGIYDDDFQPVTENGNNVYFIFPPLEKDTPYYPYGGLPASYQGAVDYAGNQDGTNQYSSLQSLVWMPNADNNKCNFVLCTLHQGIKSNTPPGLTVNEQGCYPMAIFKWDPNMKSPNWGKYNADLPSPNGTIGGGNLAEAEFDGGFTFVKRDPFGATREMGQGITKYVDDGVLKIAGTTDSGSPNDAAMLRFFEYQIEPSYYQVDGNIRVSDALFNTGTTNKWYGFVNTKVMATHDDEDDPREQINMSINEWVSANQEPQAPLKAPAAAKNTIYMELAHDSYPNELHTGAAVLSVKFTDDLDGETVDGTWTSGGGRDYYKFFATYVYEGEQESRVISIEEDWWDGTGGTGTEKRLYGQFAINNQGIHENKRIKGINIYWKENYPPESDYYLLFKSDLAKGTQISGAGDDWIPWKESDNKYIYADIDIADPPRVETFYSMNGYVADEDVSARFATAVVANRMTYIGNVDQGGVIHGDSMIKSPVNKFDIFPPGRRVDVSIRDGDSIVKLEEYADRILQFKSGKMHLINISQDVEFLEDTFMHKGIQNRAATCKTDYGIAWANENGAYLYDGKRVNNLLERKNIPLITQEQWGAFATNPIVGYSPSTRQIIVGDSVDTQGSGDIFIYNLITQSWSKGIDSIHDALKGSMMIDWNNDLIYMHGLGDIAKWDDSPAAQDMNVVTKDLDFGFPSQRKKIHKVHVTYKSGSSVPDLTYGINGNATTDTSMVSGSFAASQSNWIQSSFKPDSDANSCYSIQLKITGTSISKEFAINDISVVYRRKGTK